VKGEGWLSRSGGKRKWAKQAGIGESVVAREKAGRHKEIGLRLCFQFINSFVFSNVV
jgi:hypothetical protein